jgi:hypothetical protein
VDGIDATTWQALGVTLTLIGLVLSLLLWKRRGVTAGLRGVAWSLLPAAAGLTGTLKLLWQIGNSILRWAVHLVFSPLVWGGVVLAGVSLVLFAVTAAMRARGLGGRPSPDVEGRRRPAAQLPAERSRKKAAPVAQDKDMDDIEAILRKHGIS